MHNVWDPVTIKKGVDNLENEVCKNESSGRDLHNHLICKYMVFGERVSCYQRLWVILIQYRTMICWL